MPSFIRKILLRNKRDFFVAMSAIIALFALTPVITYLYFAQDLKTRDSIMNRNDTGVVLLDRHDRPFFTFYQAKVKKIVPLSDIPLHAQQAVIAIEDKNFYLHQGFSFPAIVRSLFLDIRRKEAAYGGSTITQQLVKNALLNSNKNFLRKYQEVILASELERRFKKKEILEMYLNSAYFGEGAFGIAEASERYYGKPIKEITIAQSALLAAVLPAPSQLSPISGNQESAKNRQKIILKKMREQGYITAQQEAQALKEQIVFQSIENDINSVATHFALHVRNELIEKYGEEYISRSGFKVRTTLDLNWQIFAEKAVKDQVENLKKNNVTNGAAIVIDPKNGEVRAWVGSKDWFDESYGKIDMVTSTRQPGSSFKPIVYAAGIEKRIITPATILQDTPTTFDGNYKPLNYDRRFRGPVTVRRALANSLNVPAVELLKRVTVSDALSMAKRLGITTLTDSYYGLSLVLGTGEVQLSEMTNAYAIFANGGEKYDVTTIAEITDKRVKVIYQSRQQPLKLLGSDTAFLISSILSDNKARQEAFGNTLTISRPAAVKTGTTDNYRDAWTIGYTPSLAVGAWVGNTDNKPMDSVAGSLGAAPIWKSLIEKFLADTEVEQFIPPQGIVTRAICTTGVKNTPSSTINEYFLEGSEPQKTCFVATVPSPTMTQQSLSAPRKENEEKQESSDEGKRKESVKEIKVKVR